MSEGMSQSLLSLTVIFPFQSQGLKEKNAKKQTEEVPVCVTH